jgi:hypothetical protein
MLKLIWKEGQTNKSRGMTSGGLKTDEKLNEK